MLAAAELECDVDGVGLLVGEVGVGSRGAPPLRAVGDPAREPPVAAVPTEHGAVVPGVTLGHEPARKWQNRKPASLNLVQSWV